MADKLFIVRFYPNGMCQVRYINMLGEVCFAYCDSLDHARIFAQNKGLDGILI